MTDEKSAEQAADDNPDAGHSPQVAATAEPEIHQAANVATAVELVQKHGSTLEAAGAWLHAQLAGIFASVEHAIKAIEERL